MFTVGKEHTIDITEPTSLALFSVVKSAGPIDGNVALLSVEASSALHRATSADAAELEQAVEDRTIVANVVLCLLALVGLHIVGRYPSKKFYVLVGVKLRHLIDDCGFRSLPGAANISKTIA